MVRPPRDPDDDPKLTSDGRIDPARLDVAVKPRRKRKARNRPQPSEELRQAEAAMEKRSLARPHPPGVILEAAGFDEEHWTAPHSDSDLWTLQLAVAFGTRSRAVLYTFMRQLEKLCGRDIWDEETQQWRLDEHEYSAALAMVNTVKPKDEMQAALAAQMVAVHMMQMKCSARALRYDTDTQTTAVAAKLARTFTLQLEALQSLQGKKRTARQSIKVSKETHHHQHIHVHRDRGAEENDAQPQEPGAATVEGRAALPGPREGHGEVVPFPRDEGKEGVPETRGSESRRSKGKG